MTFLSVKRIRSSYQRRILNWLVDSGGSVSQIAKALEIRTPHASLALTKLREKGLVIREDIEGRRGAIHKLTEEGRQRLEEDYLLLYQKYSLTNHNDGDAVVLDSRGSIILLGYVNNPPKELICLPSNPYSIGNTLSVNSSGSTGVRWASVQSESIRWYSPDTLKQVQPQNEITRGTLDDWFDRTNSFAIVRANLFDSQTPWNVTAGTWFKTPEYSQRDLPTIISEGEHLIGNIVDSRRNVFWHNRLHAHLNSNVDVSMLINSISSKAIVLRHNITRPKNTILPLGCLRTWLRSKHQRMSNKRIDAKFTTICESILKNQKSTLSLSVLRDISKDFGDCEWSQEIPRNIEVSNLSQNGVKSLATYIRKTTIDDFILEWNWTISDNLEFLQRILDAETCRLLITKKGEFIPIKSASGYLLSQPNLAEVKLILSREHSLNLQLTSIQENTPFITHQLIPANAVELLNSYSSGVWDLELISGVANDYDYRQEIWQACYMYPLGNEDWANKIESSNPLASWIASPEEFRASRWIRLSNKLRGKWADLLKFNKLDIESIFNTLNKASNQWQLLAIRYLSEKFIENNEAIITVSHLIDDDNISSFFSASLLLACDRLPDEFQELILQAIDYWIDKPLFVTEILEKLLVVGEKNLLNRERILHTLIKGSKIHPVDSIFYNWGTYVTNLLNNDLIANEQMRLYMQIFPYSWWYHNSSEWLQVQLATSSGRRWLIANEFPWPALVARLDGELCGPPGRQSRFIRRIPKSADLFYIPMMQECRAKEFLMDLYDMIVAYEDGLEMAPGRTHPLVGLLLKNESKWPKIPHKAIADGNKEVGSLLFGISFHKSLF